MPKSRPSPRATRAVMEKVKVDTEIRKLDQLRASHINQQHKIRWEIKNLPEKIDNGRKYHTPP